MLTIKNYHKIEKMDIPSTMMGGRWFVSKVEEHSDRYDFILHPKDVSVVLTITIGRKLKIGHTPKPSYKVYKNWNGLDTYVTADWISDIDNVLTMFSKLC